MSLFGGSRPGPRSFAEALKAQRNSHKRRRADEQGVDPHSRWIDDICRDVSKRFRLSQEPWEDSQKRMNHVNGPGNLATIGIVEKSDNTVRVLVNDMVVVDALRSRYLPPRYDVVVTEITIPDNERRDGTPEDETVLSIEVSLVAQP